jgi:hypothetical protein
MKINQDPEEDSVVFRNIEVILLCCLSNINVYQFTVTYRPKWCFKRN